MVDYEQNLDTELANVFKGILRLIVGSDTYSFVELQELETNFIVTTSKHYTHTGKKKVRINGDDSNFRVLVMETADMVATEASDPPAPSGSEQLTISYLLDQMITKRNLPTLNFDAIETTEKVATPNVIHHQFVAVCTEVPIRRELAEGGYVIELVGEITEHSTTQLQSTV